jgi:predicted DNA-binding transcriptional regulator YafY
MSSLYEQSQNLIRILESRRSPVSFADLQKELSASRANLFRILKRAKESGTIIHQDHGGYALGAQSRESPGWNGFSPVELESLAVLWQMLENSQNEWTEQHSGLRSALLQRLRAMGIRIEDWEGRVRYLPQHRRKTPRGVFQKISHALLHRKVIRFRFAKSDGTNELREVHPQQLVLYRNGWSLDALEEGRIGHLNSLDLGIRQYSLDLISEVREVKINWIEIPTTTLAKELAGGYGLFAGRADAVAEIRFSGIAAFYVTRETWHKKQETEMQPDGSVVMKIPFVTGHPEELLGDILRWGEHAEVIGPPALRERVRKNILGMAAKYQKARL